MNKRIGWIDIARYLGIMAVMLSHLEACPNFLRVFVTPFYLAIFFFCSGYCYRHQDDFKTFLKKKIRTLVWPWFFYSNLNIVLSNIVSFKEHRYGFLTELYRNLLQIRYYDERLWFLPALFSAFIVFYLVVSHYEKKHDSAFVLGLCFILCLGRKLYKTYMDPELLPWKLTTLPWHIDYIPTALLFMVLGYLFRNEYEENFARHNSVRLSIVLTVVYLTLITLADLYLPENAIILEFLIDHLRHILALIAIVSWTTRLEPGRYVSYVGANTLIYFCIHNKFMTLLEVIIKKLFPAIYALIINNIYLSAIYCVIITIFLSLILIIPTIIINRWLPWTLGKKQRG